jgi:hypothetical protein
MDEAYAAGVLLIVLLVSAAVGMVVRRLLPERHQSRESIEIVQLVITLLITFAALVMGLLVVSVKTSFDAANKDMATLAARIVQADQVLREYGPETNVARGLLRGYTASVIASTWPDEPLPAGDYYQKSAPPIVAGGMENRDLGDVLTRIGSMLRQLNPSDEYHRNVASDCRTRFEALVQARWTVIEQAHPIISTPFYLVLVFWLMVIFACFGLTAPRNGFVIAMIALCSVSIASAVYVILEMDTPFQGFIMISSEPMRIALADVSQ